jgi:hypothetical protein
MSIKGSPGRWFDAGVHRGDLSAALAEAADLPRPLPLGRALGLVVACAAADDRRYDRWAARWAGRLAVERRSVDLAVLAEIVALLRHGAALRPQERRALGELAERHGAVGARALLAPAARRPPR